MFTDSHCHLSFPELASQLPALLLAMREARVSRALCISTRMEEFEQIHAMVMAHDCLWATAGVHPDYEEDAREPTVDELVALAARPRVVGIGETGLDYFRLGERSVADMEWQRDRFRVHIRAARAAQVPLVVHTRSSAADTLAILKEEGEDGSGGGAGGVFHCFTESREVARSTLDLGYHISFSGILTFRNAQDLRDVAQFVPRDRLLIETDSPYLAPVPYRGKINTPAYVPWVAKQLAHLHNCSEGEMAELTSQNFLRLFSRANA